jgi:hypothetical protein
MYHVIINLNKYLQNHTKIAPKETNNYKQSRTLSISTPLALITDINRGATPDA